MSALEMLGTALCVVMTAGVVIGVITLYVLIEIEKYKERQRKQEE